MNCILGTESVEQISISFLDMYHDVAKDFGINLEANLNVREADITFNDDLEEKDLELIFEQPENQDSFPVVPVKDENYLKFSIKTPDEFSKLMQREGALRKKIKMLDDARGTIRSKCHSYYIIEVHHKQTGIRKVAPTYLFFLKLFASDKEGQLRFHTIQF